MNSLNVLYEDNHIIVVNKPCNVLSQADNTNDSDMLSIVKNYIKVKYNKPGNVYLGLIHRLDRPVSGIMVFARTSKAASRLSEQVRNHLFSKKYVAVVNGIIKSDSGEFVDYLKKIKNNSTVVTNSSDGKRSELSYKVLARNYKRKLTLVEVSLKTGRHHQIRVQFASRGFSLCGDQRYGNGVKMQLELCAYKLSFYHPITKELLCFAIDIPSYDNWTLFTM
ncbi:MAG: RluA family pseudouridine synthase [Bacilli bacterium]|nr:RluA family pseudouridine synthase [Bacilli bacterium]